MIPFIDLAAQQTALKPDIDSAIAQVLAHGRYIMGPEVAEMEQALAAHVGSVHCIAVASGTEALLIALMALGIGPGDEVILPAFTFAASAEVVILAGATPVLADIEPDTCNLDASAIEPLVSERTRAIMPVSLYGQCADMDEINAIAQTRGIAVIEDAAQSFGADYGGRGQGNYGGDYDRPAAPAARSGGGGGNISRDMDDDIPF